MRTYSRRELYALGETLGESVTTRKVGGGLILGGGGGGAPTQTTSTSYQTNIPEYARPYVETMLGATQQQLFQGTPTGDGGFNITGFQPYKAYGGTYDAQGNQTSYDPTKAVAGFSPLQQQAQQGTANLQTPNQYNQAMGVTGAGIMNAANLGAQSNPQDYQQNVAGYMNPYMQQVLQPQMDELRRQYGISGTQQAGQATQAGAFGGSRDAIMAAENQRNLGTAQNQAIGQAYNNAFGQAQNQYNQNAGFQLQANNAAMQGANQLAGLGQQQLTAQQGILGLQNQMGAQQQAYQQQVINQSLQDYANAQQYPLMQLGTMSNMIRGLPMQAQTTNQYAAAPNQLTQGIGAAGAAASLYNATSGQSPQKAAGGEIKSMASGGIASYDVGGRIRAQLQNMDPQELQQVAETSESPEMQKMAKEILARAEPVQRAAGGIMKYSEGDQIVADASQARDTRTVSDAEPLPSEGIMMAKNEPAKADALGINKAPVLNNAVAKTTPEMAFPTGKISSDSIMRNPIFGPSAETLLRQKEANEAADKPIESFRADVENRYGTNQPLKEYLKEKMAERANLGDEAYRQKQLRLAEFFATWGSTPGATLVAGMTALKKSIPGIIEDSREAKKLQREADKIIYDLGQAERAEKMGLDDKALAMKNAAAALAERYNKEVDTVRERQFQTAASFRTAESHEAVAAQQGEANKIARQSADENKKYLMYQHAVDKLNSHQKEKEAAETSKNFLNDKKIITNATLGAVDDQGNLDESKINPAFRPNYEAAKKRMETHEDAWDKLKEKLQKEKEDAFSLFKGEKPKGPSAGETTAPPPSVVKRDPATFNEQEKAAAKWAKENPKDPRTPAIKARLGI